jgi:hypothetical protein
MEFWLRGVKAGYERQKLLPAVACRECSAYRLRGLKAREQLAERLCHVAKGELWQGRQDRNAFFVRQERRLDAGVYTSTYCNYISGKRGVARL